MSLIFEATAIKVTNNAGGWYKGKKQTGTDYVTFICPGCTQRNKQSMYEAENYVPAANRRIPFRCRKCRNIVELAPPEVHKPIMSPGEYTQLARSKGVTTEPNRIVGRP